MTLGDKIAIGEKSAADGKRLQADVPEPEIARLIDVAHALQRRQKAVCGRGGKLHPMRKIGQRQAALGLGERLEYGKSTGKALHLPDWRPGLARRATAARRRGVAVRNWEIGNRESAHEMYANQAVAATNRRPEPHNGNPHLLI